MPIGLSEHACKESVENLNQLLADTMALRNLYKKHHWQVAGPTFYHIGRSWRIIQFIPKRSWTCANRLAKNVSSISINARPPSPNAA
jgi:hypothetical protein